ncbi:MAG: formylmethanofuran dehydrogenase subunit E family protein [Candidatus Omnitrophota bacterium]
MTSLNQALRFHGHLGPWLVLGLFMGEYGLKKINAKKFFGLEIKAKIPNRKPISCLVDGLQLSSGCTLGKGNIRTISNKEINVEFINKKNKKSITLGINNSILKKLNELKTHRDSIRFAKQIFRMRPDAVIKILRGVS